MRTTANVAAWERCEAMLTAMHAGDLTTVAAVVDETGLGAESAELLLATLVRADLFEQRGHQFIRVSVFGGAELR